MAIIILAFVPVFALTGMEGKLFHPLAFTKTFAMVGSTIIAVTLVPVLCTFLIRGRLHREEDNPVMRLLRGVYAPTLRFALAASSADAGIAAAFFAVGLALSGDNDRFRIHAAAGRRNRHVDARHRSRAFRSRKPPS